jgi:3',5'-cyclic AMP phosphodiesterase CpdA
MFRFVHLSDIHFGQEKKDKTTYIHEDVRNELIRDVQLQAAKHGNADGILVTGDIAYSGKKEEFVGAASAFFLSRVRRLSCWLVTTSWM